MTLDFVLCIKFVKYIKITNQSSNNVSLGPDSGPAVPVTQTGRYPGSILLALVGQRRTVTVTACRSHCRATVTDSDSDSHGHGTQTSILVGDSDSDSDGAAVLAGPQARTESHSEGPSHGPGLVSRVWHLKFIIGPSSSSAAELLLTRRPMRHHRVMIHRDWQAAGIRVSQGGCLCSP
jgi:hypothetical protein